MNDKRNWRAFTIEQPNDLVQVIDAYRSQTGKRPISVRLSNRCKPEILKAVRQQFSNQIEQVPWLLSLDIWLTHEQPARLHCQK